MSLISKDTQDKINAILKKVGLSATEEPQAKQFLASAKLVDGSEIHTTGEAFAAGGDCYFKDADGKDVPAPDGNYEMEDGKMVSVTGGVITAVEEKKAEESEDMKKVVDENTALRSAITDIKTTLSAEIERLSVELEATKVKLTSAETRATKLGKMVPGKQTTETENKKETARPEKLGYVNPMVQKVREGIAKHVSN